MNRASLWATRIAFAGILCCMSATATAWSIVADFEGGIVGQKPQGVDTFSEAFRETKFADAVVFDGTRSARLGITAGSTGFGEWGGRIDYPVKLYEGSEIWVRASVYFPTTFNYTANPRLKFLRLHTLTTVGGNDGYLDLYILPNGKFAYDNEITNFTTVNDMHFGPPIVKGVWETYEVYAKFNSVAGRGIYRVWKNGKLIYQDMTVKTLRTTSSYSDFVYIFSYWNGGAPQTQHMYLDDVIVTTERPNCRDDAGNYVIGSAKSSAPACNRVQ